MASSTPAISPTRAVGGDWFTAARFDDVICGGFGMPADEFPAASSWALDEDFGEEPMFPSDDPSTERQVILEEMRAAGLHRPGGFKRQAFSLSDLTSLQPPSEAAGTSVGSWLPPVCGPADSTVWNCAQPVVFKGFLEECAAHHAGSNTAGQFLGQRASIRPHISPTQPSRRGHGAQSVDELQEAANFVGPSSDQTVNDGFLGCIPEHGMPAPAGTSSAVLEPSRASRRALLCDKVAAEDSPTQDLAAGAGGFWRLRSSKIRRSQSALELGSLGASANLQHAKMIPQFASKPADIELTTPDGHVYTAGKLSAEERQQKILKYRQKRHERNFTKRIKYQCRKTLADSRPRVRGRFARNDDASAVLPASVRQTPI